MKLSCHHCGLSEKPNRPQQGVSREMFQDFLSYGNVGSEHELLHHLIGLSDLIHTCPPHTCKETNKTNKAWLLTLSTRVKRRILQKKKEVMMLTEIQNHNRYKAELKTHQRQGDHVFLCRFQTWPQVMQGSMLHAQSVSASLSASMEYWSMNLLCHPKP